MKKKILFCFVFALCLLGFFSAQTYGNIIQSASGFSITGTAVTFESQLTITNNLLTIELFNISPVATNSPDDLLSSYFFDIQNSIGQRPILNLLAVSGDVYKTSKNYTDKLQTAGANLKAVKSKDDTWKFLALNSEYNPFLGFGIGTVGNSNMSPNNFPGNVVGGMNYSIYTGDVTTQNLNNRFLVKNSAVFTFSGLSGFTESNIMNSYVFGLGTAPDNLLTYTAPTVVPEPATVALLCLGVLFLTKK